MRNLSKVKGVGRPHNPHRYIKLWANRFVTTRSLQNALIPGATASSRMRWHGGARKWLSADVELEDGEVKHFWPLAVAKHNTPIFYEAMDE